jgi:hypothetical protein
MSIHIYTKKCTKCNEIKSIDEFGISKSAKDGHNFNCKQCRKQHYINNREDIIEKSRQYYIDNKKDVSLYQKQYYIDNKKDISLYKKQYRTDNIDYIKKKSKQYRTDNIDYIKNKCKQYHKYHALYETYAHQLTMEEEPRLADDGVALEVRCKYCGKYFKPTNMSISSRILSINGNYTSDNSLYCSDNCKKSCGTYGQKVYPKGFKTNTSREVQPQLRKLVLERDIWMCQKCSDINAQLHCHHFEGIEINPIESADIDNCITLCKACHNIIHKQKGCDMRRNKCN